VQPPMADVIACYIVVQGSNRQPDYKAITIELGSLTRYCYT
jgi:hypothetical protein